MHCPCGPIRTPTRKGVLSKCCLLSLLPLFWGRNVSADQLSDWGTTRTLPKPVSVGRFNISQNCRSKMDFLHASENSFLGFLMQQFMLGLTSLFSQLQTSLEGPAQSFSFSFIYYFLHGSFHRWSYSESLREALTSAVPSVCLEWCCMWQKYCV